MQLFVLYVRLVQSICLFYNYFYQLLFTITFTCTIKPANIGHCEERTPPNGRYFCLEWQVSTENTYK